jgi:hypothetical protein
MFALSLVCASYLVASSTGCCGACGRCGSSMHGNADGGCPSQCDRYAARPYRRFMCGRPRRDPRIPGPRVISTLPPEPQAPGYFHPVPTYPVFGPRSEQPDGIEPDLQPMSPGGMPGMESEPLPAPPDADLSDDESMDGDNEVSDDEASPLQLAAPQQLTKHAGWKPAKKQPASVESATRPGAKCTVTFRQPSSQTR